MALFWAFIISLATAGLPFLYIIMAKRFTDTEKWNDDWYISLSNDYRIIWQWLLDNCNHAGLCKRSMGLLNLICRTDITEEELLHKMDGRLLIHNDYWFIPKFLKFQYSTLLSSKPAIISVVKMLYDHEVFRKIPESFGNHYLIISESFHNHCQMIKDKDKDISINSFNVKKQAKEKSRVVEENNTLEKNFLENSNLFRKPNSPTFQEIEFGFHQIGGTKEMAESFFDKYESTGWFLNGSPITNWKSLANRYVANWKNNQDKKQNSAPKTPKTDYKVQTPKEDW